MASVINDIYSQLPSPPLSPLCDDDFNIDLCGCKEVTKKVQETSNLPIESSLKVTQEDLIRAKYMEMMEEGVENSESGEKIPYPYFIKKLHSIGKCVINKKTKDALPLRVYEAGKEIYEDFWVHPIFLSSQSYQFFKLFEEVRTKQEQGIIEIEVPSLKAFAFVLYFMYTGDLSKLLEIAKLDESYCKGIMDIVQYLEINMTKF